MASTAKSFCKTHIKNPCLFEAVFVAPIMGRDRKLGTEGPKIFDFHSRGHQKQEIEGSRKSFEKYLKKAPFLEAFGSKITKNPLRKGLQK